MLSPPVTKNRRGIRKFLDKIIEGLYPRIMAGQKIAIYDAYLADWQRKHPNMVEPQYFGIGNMAEAEAIEGLAVRHGRDLNTRMAKALTYVPLIGIYELPGSCEIVEVGRTTSGRGSVVAVFPSEQARLAYARPMSIQEYFDEW